MSSLSQSSWLCSLHTTKTMQPTKKLTFLHPKIATLTKPQKSPVFSVTNSSNNGAEQTSEESKPNRVKLALEKAREYKKSLKLDKIQENNKEIAKESIGIVGDKENNVENGKFSDKGDVGRDGDAVSDAVRLAMEKVEELEKNEGKVGDNNSIEEIDRLRGDGNIDGMVVSEAVEIAMGKTEEYKKNDGNVDSSSSIVESSKSTESERGSASKSRDASIDQNTEKKEDLRLSSIDFAGLNFADKKKGRGLPAGLVPVADPFSMDELPDVEILVGDASKFGNAATSESATSSQEESADLYKPKVSTWGLFPRPNNISETYGGGRTIRPGDELESQEDRAAKEAQSRKLIAAYKSKMGLNMDPKLKAECEKALNDGDSLMDVGRLKQALPFYQTVMDKLPFQTRLHGLAALNWSICQDSLARPEEARVMYEKLQTHPNGEVSKKARQFMFSFEAMEMLKVTRSSTPRKNTEYQSYFDSFVEDEAINTSVSNEEKVDALNEAVLYIVFLASPILLVLLFVAMKRV